MKIYLLYRSQTQSELDKDAFLKRLSADIAITLLDVNQPAVADGQLVKIWQKQLPLLKELSVDLS